MKSSIFKVCLTVTVSAVACLAAAADPAYSTNSPSTTAATPSAQPPAVAPAPPAVVAQAAPAQLPYGVEDVLRLSRAQINEDIVLNYVQNSGTIYNLNPSDIVYLRNEGVSDRVVNAMLDQRKRVPEETAAQTAAAPASPAVAPPAYVDPNFAAAQGYIQPAPVYIQPPVVEEPAPAPSTLYVIPYPTASLGFYGYSRPYGYGCYGYGQPYRRSSVIVIGRGSSHHGGHSYRHR